MIKAIDKPGGSIPAEVALLGLMVCLYFVYGFNLNWVFDDAYFFVRYAENLLAGHGYTWNPGDPPVNGLTSPLWLVMVLPTVPLSSPEAIWSGRPIAWMSAIFALTLLPVLHFSIRGLLPPRSRPLAILAPLFLVVTPVNISGIGNSGMETGMACCLFVVYLSILGRAWIRGGMTLRGAIPAGILGFLLVPARPEFGLTALLAPGILLIAEGKRRTGSAMAAFLATTVGLLLVYTIFHFVMFGDIFPQSFHVKAPLWQSPYKDFSIDAQGILFQFPLFFLRDSIVLQLAVLIGLLSRNRWRHLAWLWIPLYATMLYLSTTLQIMGYSHRYYFPFACGLLILVALCFTNREGEDTPVEAPLWLTPRRVYTTCAILLVVLGATYLALPGSRLRAFNPGPNAVHPRIARLVHNLPGGTSIAATEVGILAAYNPHLHIIDCSGLNDPVFSRGFDADELFRRRPDIITLIHGDYIGMTSDIRSHPAWTDYRPVRVLMPERGDYHLDTNIHVNTKSDRYAEIVGVLERARE